MSAWFVTPDAVLRGVAAVASIYAVHSSAEYLAARDHLADDGILSWEVARHRKLYQLPLLSNVLSYSLAYRPFLGVLGVRLVAGVLVCGFALVSRLNAGLLAVVLVTTIAISVRNPYGLDGGYQMAVVVFGGLFLASLFPAGAPERALVVLFIATQGVLAYFLAGLSKLSADQWRGGTAVTGIFGTDVFGNERLYDLFQRRPPLAMALCWATIAFECLFPAVLLVDSRGMLIFLGAGFLFHLFNALVMGLNGFVAPFLATYPAIAYARYLLGTMV